MMDLHLEWSLELKKAQHNSGQINLIPILLLQNQFSRPP